MNLTEKFEAAQAAAPSYVEVDSDGFPYTCKECGIRNSVGFVKSFTPDGRLHPICHLECIDPEWLKLAKKMEFSI